MTKEEAKLVLDNARPQTKEIDRQFYDDEDLNNALDMAIKALEQSNEEIFKQFKKKVFLESEDVLGNEMVDSYMITDCLAELLGVEND